MKINCPSPDSSGILLWNAMEQKIERIAGIAPDLIDNGSLTMDN